jgi:hypothetical protein
MGPIIWILQNILPAIGQLLTIFYSCIWPEEGGEEVGGEEKLGRIWGGGGRSWGRGRSWGGWGELVGFFKVYCTDVHL